MAGGLGIGERWARMMNMLSGCDQSSNGEISIMTLVWPLLPLLPPQPPPLLTELLRETDTATEEKCDLCGKPGKPFIKCCGGTSLMTQTNVPEAELRHRPVGQKRSSLDMTIEGIEDRVDEILNSIEQTTIRINELSRQRKNMYDSEKPVMTDVELLNRLKSLVKQKETQGRRVKTLEIKKQKAEESLITAITWAKSLSPKGQNIPVSPGLPIQKQHRPTLDQQQDSTQENILPTKENGIITDQRDTIEGIENDDNSTQEGNNENFLPTKNSDIITDNIYYGRASVPEGQVTEVTIDIQPLLERGVSDVNVMLENDSQDMGSNNNVMIINHLSPSDEELSKKSIDAEASNMS